MCKPDPDENKNTSVQTLSQDRNELEANEDEANDENIKQGQRNENMKEGDIERNNTNDQKHMAEQDEN